jgi:hypothetical protein
MPKQGWLSSVQTHLEDKGKDRVSVGERAWIGNCPRKQRARETGEPVERRVNQRSSKQSMVNEGKPPNGGINQQSDDDDLPMV